MSKSLNGICMIEYQYKQIGMGEKYFKNMVAVLEGNVINIKREVLLYRIRGASNSPFDDADLDAINDNTGTPVGEIILLKMYPLVLYEELHKEYPYIVSMDPATGSGVGHDNTAINIIDPYTLRSIGVLSTPYSNAVDNSEMLAELVTKYTPKCMLVIERNSLGKAVIDIIERTPIVANMYWDKNKTLEYNDRIKLDKKGFVDRDNGNSRYYGVATTTKTRDIMTKELLTNYVRNHKERFIAKELIQDLNNLCVTSSERIEARNGTHDDVVMSYLIGCYAYEYGSNIQNWGLSKTMKLMGPVKDQKIEDYTYDDIYATMPEEMKKIFPAPNQSIDLLERETENQMSQHEIYKQIQLVNAARREVKQNDGTTAVVRSNVDVENIIKNATENQDDIDKDVFDLCNFIND